MKAVIFDLGNVLVNYDGKATFQALSDLIGISLETLWDHFQTYDHAFGTGELNGRAYCEKCKQDFNFAASYEQFTAAFCRYQQRNEEALAFAMELQAREAVTVGIISNTNEIHAAWLYANLPELKSFSSVLLSHEVGLLKPDAAIYQLALTQLGVAPEQAVFMDDLAENVAGATAVGLTGYWHKTWHLTRPFIENWLQNKPHLPKS